MSRPHWTLSEAAEHVGVSRSTLRRRLDVEAFPHAYRDGSGVWRLPLEDLLAAGFSPAQPVSTSSVTELGHDEGERAHDLVQRLQAAETALSIERAQRQAAEQVAAAERGRADALEMALRLIEAGPSAPIPGNVPAVEPARPPGGTDGRRRSWWLRRRDR